jgi:hypothetical protein
LLVPVDVVPERVRLAERKLEFGRVTFGHDKPLRWVGSIWYAARRFRNQSEGYRGSVEETK